MSIYNIWCHTLCDRTRDLQIHDCFFFFVIFFFLLLSFSPTSVLFAHTSWLINMNYGNDILHRRRLSGIGSAKFKRQLSGINLRKRTRRGINKGLPGKHGPPAADHRLAPSRHATNTAMAFPGVTLRINIRVNYILDWRPLNCMTMKKSNWHFDSIKSI